MKKKIIITLILLVFIPVANAATKKWTQYDELTTIADADILLVVDDVAGTPTSKKITVLNLFDTIDTFAELNTIVVGKTLVNEEDAVTWDALGTFGLGITITTGDPFTLGANRIDNGSDLLDGEMIGDNTIDDDSLDLGDITGVDFTLTDCGAITSTGTITATVGFDIVGAADIDYGSIDVTDHTFVTDGTGDAEIVLPNDSIGDAEIDWSGLTTSADFTITGTLITSVGIDGVGAVDLDYGSVDITDHTFVTDSTGDAEIVLPNDSIGDAEIDWSGLTTSADFTVTGTLLTSVGIDGVGAVDLDYGSVDITDHTFTTDDCTVIIDGGVTISTGDVITLGVVQWNSADEIDGTKIKDADYGDIDVSAGGAWTLDTDSVADNEIDYSNVTFADFDYETAWKMWHSNAAGDVTEITLGADGTFLESNGAAAAPAFRALVDGDIPDDITIDLATLASTVTTADDEATADNQEIVFTTTPVGAAALETDGDFHYNPSTGTVTATEFVGGGSGLTGLTILTEEQVEDFVGGMLGGTETDITVTYQDATNDIDFVVTSLVDIVTTSPLTVNAGANLDDVIVGSDADITLAITVLKDLVTTAPVTGGTDNILTGSDSDVTIALDFTDSWDFGGAAGFELPNAAAPTTNAAGEIALDTTITDHQPLWQYYDGGENMTLIAIDTAQLPAEDNEAIVYDAASDKFVLEAQAGAAGGDAWGDAVDADILPTGADDTYDIGAADAQFKDGYFDGTLEADVLTENGNAVLNSTELEGTSILSTGEGGGTKFLREDGDGTCSWQATAGSTAWDDIGDPDNSGQTTITFDNGEWTRLTGNNDTTGSFFELQNTDADHTVGIFFLLDLNYSLDNGDPQAKFIKFQDNGGIVGTIGADAEIDVIGNISSDGTVEGATLTEGGNAVWNATETDIIDSGHYIAGSIDYEHLAQDVISGAAAVGTFESGDTFLVLEAGVGLREADYDDLPGAATAWDDIDDADAAGSIDFVTHTQTLDIGKTDDGGGSGLILDVTGLGAGTDDVIALEITTSTDDDTDYVPIAIYDDSGGDNDLLFHIDSAGGLTSAGIVTASSFAGVGSSITSVDAATGDSATAFFDAGTIEHEYGGLEADISSYTGLVAITGGSTAEVDAKSELEGHIADVADFAEADGDTWTGVHDFSGVTTTVPWKVNATAAPTVEGQAIWESDTDELTVGDGTASIVVAAKTNTVFCFNIHDIDAGMDDIKMPFTRATTITKVTAFVTGGTNVVGRLYEVDGDGDDADAVGVESSDWTFTAGETEDSSFNNATFDAGDYIQWDTTSVSGSVTGFMISVEGYEI